MNSTRCALWGVTGAAMGATLCSIYGLTDFGGPWALFGFPVILSLWALVVRADYRRGITQHYTPALLKLMSDCKPRDASACAAILEDFDGNTSVMIHVILGKLERDGLIESGYQEASSDKMIARLGAYVYTITRTGVDRAKSQTPAKTSVHS